MWTIERWQNVQNSSVRWNHQLQASGFIVMFGTFWHSFLGENRQYRRLLSICLFVVWCSLTVVLTSISSEKVHFQRKRSCVIITSLLYKHRSSHTISMWEITQLFWRKRLSNMHNNWASQMTTLTHFGYSIFLWNKSLFYHKSKDKTKKKNQHKVILVIP